MNSTFHRHLICPWCQKGEVLADGQAKISLSIECPKCHRFFIGSMDTLKAERSAACKRTGRKK